ncbi:hypothetical protein QJS04_geneDACA005638 [Acorus gramineus]|uniref:HAT C-terminal dimerisation domain-containing protein n=1 Tax=Acorus gramineus TaxID=55184 RepID=A0AAV9A5F9_ACOGR|nr:hypothetical protein QJS04_geneDACA005638 [Acorus gramineus]
MSKQRMGMEAKEVIMDPLFWSSCARIMKVAKPLITALHLADSEERLSMGYLYDAIEKARKSIIVAFNNKESDYFSYMKVIDRTWEDLCNPLHAASYYLNPSIFYYPSFSSNSIIKKSLLDCIETLEPDSTAQVTITRQIKYYEEAMGDFSRPLALRGRESLPPATWWSLYASNYPELQRFAVRILSQTCSGTRCGKDDSMFERMRSSKKNLIELERLSHLTFVHHNLHLQQRQPAELGSSTLAWGACDPICVGGVNINAREWVEHHEGPGHDPHWIDVTLQMNDKIHNINDYIINIDHGGTTDNGSNDRENS